MKQTIADLIPARARKVIYIAVPLFVALEAIWDFLPNGFEDKVTATIAALGFGLAFSQTSDQP